MLAYLFTDDSLFIHSSELLMISKGKHINYIANMLGMQVFIRRSTYVLRPILARAIHEK